MSERLTDPLASVQLARENKIPNIPEIHGDETWSDPFWDHFEIDETRWDASYPFQFLLLKREGSGYVTVPFGTFTLPIPPEALSVSTPFAITPSILQEGVVEEHNGAPIKAITLSGTTGILPGRGTGKTLKSFNVARSIYAGTVRATEQTASVISNNFVANIQNPLLPTIVTDSDILGELKGTTGYYQFLLLQQFLERYVFIKKTKAGAKYRLAFANWKTQEVYLVTPQVFTVTRAARPNPLKFMYTASMLAWRRVNINQGVSTQPEVRDATRNPGILQQVLKKIDEARRVLFGLQNVIESVRQDTEAVLLEPLREVALFAKDALGVAISAADLPSNIVKDMKGAILEASGIATDIADSARDLRASVRQYAITKSKTETGAGDIQTQRGDGLSAADPDPANAALEDPAANYEFFSKLRPGDLNLPPSVTRKIVQERERVRNLTRRDFEKMRDQFVAVLADFEAAVGAGHETYAQTYGRTLNVTSKTPNADDFDVIFALNSTIMEMNRLAVGSSTDQSKVTPIEYIAGLAGRSGINFQIPKSFLRVPFPYGSTLEQVAARYLGDAGRWHEIAALNRLREPYVDEEGFDLPLVTNGSGNEVVVGSADNLYVGQAVWISSTTSMRTKRRITDIARISAGYVIVRVDGDGDLDQFSPLAQASLHAFLPDTVNSQMLIAIPSDRDPSDEVFDTRSIPGLDEYDYLLQVGGVDLLLSTDGDAAITPDGDWRLAVGLTNLVQRVRLFADTPRGSLLHHPTYGMRIRAGQSTADISAKELLASVSDLFTFDPVFTGIKSAEVVKNGPSMRMGVTLEVAGSDHLIPISFDVRS